MNPETKDNSVWVIDSLEGNQLNVAAAMALGLEVVRFHSFYKEGGVPNLSSRIVGEIVARERDRWMVVGAAKQLIEVKNYCGDWGDGGSILENAGIWFSPNNEGVEKAVLAYTGAALVDIRRKGTFGVGRTRLEAGFRCFCSMKFGAELTIVPKSVVFDTKN